LAGIDLVKNKPTDALKFLQEQINHNPNSSALYQVQGEIELRSKRNELAEAAFSRAVDLDHTNVAALVLRAQTRSTLNKTDLAISDYLKAIELSPRDPRLDIALGTLYEKSGDWQRARDSYQKALAIQPEEPLASNNLAYLLLEHDGDVNVALSLAQVARKGLPNLPNSADTLGWAYYHTGAYSAAVPLFEGAVKNQPENQAYRYHLGLTYQKLKNASRAREEFEKAISIDPKSHVADQARQAISQKPVS
jgi:tetratricopeptide (TPR) repeat protein